MAKALPTILLERLEAAFRAARDPAKALPMKAYMRDQFEFFGISRAERDRIVRDALEGTAAPSEDELAKIARACWKKPEREWQYFAQGYLRKWVKKVAGPGFLEVARELITSKSWWDTVDELAHHVVGVLVEKYPELGETMDAWAKDENLWVARTAILHQNRYRDRTNAKRLFAYCRLRANEKDFFMRKAIGWALRVYAATDPDAVEQFVQKNDALLSPLSKKEALRGVARARA